MEDVLIAAIINARVATAVLRCEAMRADNLIAQARGLAPTFSGEAFQRVIEEEGIHHNAVFGTINDMRRY